MLRDQLSVSDMLVLDVKGPLGLMISSSLETVDLHNSTATVDSL